MESMTLPGDKFTSKEWLEAKQAGETATQKLMPPSLHEAINEVLRIAAAAEIPIIVGMDMGDKQESFYDLGPHAKNVSAEFMMARNAVATFSNPAAAHYTQSILFNGGMQFLKRLPR